MSHDHGHVTSWSRRLVVVMALNLLIPALQVYGGLVSGSMALISDALHNIADFTAVAISYIALRLGERRANLRQTYGYRRAEVLASLLNVGFLYGIGIYMAIEAGKRLSAPAPIAGETVIGVALAALAGNAFSTWLLSRGARENLNLRGAFLHMLIDSLVSLGVLALGVVWLFYPWYWLDPLVSWIIVGLVFFSGWDILKDSVLVLMNAAPPTIDLPAIRNEVEALAGVEGLHHLHVWSLDGEGTALTAHIIVPDQMLSQVDTLAGRIRMLLSERFDIHHPVLQFESRPCETPSFLCNSSCKPSDNHH
ncbi:MAG: Cation transporter [Thermodesulfobacteriota bacterium]|nr:Cation transporter [Thermodesulfobacteriota bacterium]